MLLLILLACPPATVGGADGGASDGGASDGGAPDGGATDGGATTGNGSLTLSVDEEVVTMLRASWEDRGASAVEVEYRFGGGAWERAPAIEAGRAVLLGIPERTEVEARLVEVIDGAEVRGPSATISTGALPSWVLRPTVESFEEARADVARFALVSVDGTSSYTFGGPFQLQIFNRRGEIVWYREVPDQMLTFYPQAARDGRHIWYEASDPFGIGRDTGHVVRTTLDGRWSERVELPELGQAVGEGPDGSFFYEKRASRGRSVSLMQVDAAGTSTQLWDCTTALAAIGESYGSCWMNATNWVPDHGTVLTSMFESDTVFEIDLATRQPIRQMGQIDGGDPYDFDPTTSLFSYQHFPNYTAEGTLLVSTHQEGRRGRQFAAEYEVDDASQTLRRVWYYESTDVWATQLGEALRLRNGNTLQGYGQDGAVREVLSDGQEVWFLSWDKDPMGYRAIGHTELIDDLYALNRGPE